MAWVIFWVLCGVASAIIGGNKGRPGFAWFLFGCLVGPFGILLALMVSKQTQATPGHTKWLSNPWLGNADPLGAMPTNGRIGEHRMNTQTGEVATAVQKATAVRARMRQLGAADVGETQMLAAIFDLSERLERLERLAARDEAGARSADRDAGD